MCQLALQAVQHCLYLHPGGQDGSDVGGPILTEETATRMVLVLLAVMERVKKDGELDNLKALLYFCVL